MELKTNIAVNNRAVLIAQYKAVRQASRDICSRLAIEDHTVQPTAEVSPPKWHLGHTTWFFEELILVRFVTAYVRFNDHYRKVFNSYYKSAGEHWPQQERGDLSRPTVAEILAYRQYVDDSLLDFLESTGNDPELDQVLVIGLHHEQQHQELLYMDIKVILGSNPLQPAYSETPPSTAKPITDKWKHLDEGVYHIGHGGGAFSYDNEAPKHKTYIYPFAMSENTVTNGEYLQFINDGGYSSSCFWLSQGWDWLGSHGVQHPLYWQQQDNIWYEFTLHGLHVLDLHAPVTHISYFEADAYANWKGCRLPTEQELEIYLSEFPEYDEAEEPMSFHPHKADTKVGQVWCWTRSHYSPYPRYQAYPGMLEEYNGKFMCNQFVLKGGCIATPENHYRHTYRNFYQAHQRWMFSGIRLSKDV